MQLCRVKGKTLDEVLTITNSDIAKHLSLPPVKLHCSMLAEDAVKVSSLAATLTRPQSHMLSRHRNVPAHNREYAHSILRW